MNLEKLDQLVTALYPQMEADLVKLVEFPSIQAEPVDGKPYGQATADCLDHCLRRAQELGFVTHNEGYQFGLVDWLADQMPPERQVGILSHVDVVPAVLADWRYEPFRAQIDGGRIYGRGTIDDKGPLLAALYATVALRQFCAEEQLTPKKGVRHILGCNEENGMTCLEYYVAHFPQPSCSFSPDGAFPAAIGEKGVAHLEYRQTFSAATTAGDLQLLRVSGGTGANIIPNAAQAVLQVTEAGLTQAQAALQQMCAEERERLSLTPAAGQLTVAARGEAAHGSMPEDGYNAIALLLRYLSRLPLAAGAQADFVEAANRLLAQSSDGAGLGMRASDEVSVLTAALTMLELDAEGAWLHVDIRYPVTHVEATFRAAAEQVAAQTGWRLSLWECHGPMYVKESETPAKELLEVYREVTGDQAPPVIAGGATYARLFQNAVCFGPEFADEPYCAHQADESINLEKWLLAAKIYARALYKLCVE